MFKDKIILMFSGMLENIADQNKLLKIAKLLDPDLPVNFIPDHRFITSHFRDNNRIYDWINGVLKRISAKNIPGLRKFLQALEQENKYYNHQTKCIEVLDTENRNSSNWGLLSENSREYISILRFKLNTTNKNDINNKFYDFITPIILSHNGRIWNKNGPNVSAGFFIGDKIENGIDAAVEVLLNFIFFNLDTNNLKNNLNIKISFSSGFINFFTETKNIHGNAINTMDLLEKELIENTIIIPEYTYNQLEDYKQSFFIKGKKVKEKNYYKFKYEIGTANGKN